MERLGMADKGEEDEGGRDTVAMEFGIARALTENSALSLVYHDSNNNPEALVATVSVDF